MICPGKKFAGVGVKYQKSDAIKNKDQKINAWCIFMQMTFCSSSM
jgi:hypothetical protein